MAECSAMRESMPLLLTESLDPAARELTHQHIEGCAECSAEWAGVVETWRLMGDLPELEPPARIKQRFLAQVMPAEQSGQAKVLPFHRRPALKWVAQAAGVALLVGGSYWTGHRTAPVRLAPTQATLNSVTPASATTMQPFSIAETRVLSAKGISPTIEGRPTIENVSFIDPNPNDNEIGLSFDVTSHVTVTGAPTDKSMVRLLTYVMENEDRMSPSSSRAIDWVRQTYSDPSHSDPEIAQALAKVLRNDSHEGVRIKAVETLKTLPSGLTNETRDALIEALKNDPNPAVRMKAVDALARLAASGGLNEAAVETLRLKAVQNDENLYVRSKAAQALSNIKP